MDDFVRTSVEKYKKELAGKKVSYKMKVEEVSEYVLPEVNEQFYKDGQWDDFFCPVCSKKILKEHMEKYFDDAPDPWYYKNCREAFKNIIFDKFEDGKGLCVIYC